MKNAVLFGLIAGLGTVGYLMLCFQISPELYIEPAIIYASWIFYLLCMIMPVILRKKDGALDFKVALREAFVVFIVANAIYTAFDFVFLKYWHPDLQDMMVQKIREALDSGVLSPLKEEMKNIDVTPTISNYLLSFAQSLIAGFIMSAIIAYFFKSE